MNFGSDYILDESEEEEEIEVDGYRRGARSLETDYYDSDGSYDGGLECDIMDFEEEEEGGPIMMKRTKTKGPNMNTLNLPLIKLKDEPPETKVLNKQLFRCSNRSVCGAILSHIDKPVDPDADDKTWRCRFCGVERKIKAWPDFSAKDDDGNPMEAQDVLYIDELDNSPDLTLDPGENTVIFILDTSGSMATSVEPHGGHGGGAMMGSGGGTQMNMIMNMMMNGGMIPAHMLTSALAGQQMGEQMQARTRLTAMRDAIVVEIKKLKESDPKCKVGIVAFNEDVFIYGDGSKPMVEVTAQDMGDYSKLLTIGQQQPALGVITESCDVLVNSLMKLTEEGRTALGPAIVVAMGMAAKSKTSKLIVCTDGYANIGLGRLENGSMPQTAAFYNDVNDFCKTQGISASLISFDQCGIAKELGTLPVETGGLLCLINPKDSDLKINEALIQKTMATDAFINFVVHKSLFIDGSKVENEGDQLERSNVKKLKGNLNEKMTVAFKFGFRTDDISKQDRIEEKSGKLVEKPKERAVATQCASSDPPKYVSGSIDQTGGTNQTSDPSGKPVAIMDCDDGSGVGENKDLSTDSTVTDPPADQNSLVPVASQNIVPADSQTKATGATGEVLELPFQVQIYYVDHKGVEATRVWTNVKPVTSDRQRAEEAADLTTIVSNILQTWSQRFLDINNNKIEDANLNSEARKATEEINKTMEQIDANAKPNEHNRLNEFLELVRKIQTTQNIAEDVAVKLRTFQTGSTGVGDVTADPNKGGDPLNPTQGVTFDTITGQTCPVHN